MCRARSCSSMAAPPPRLPGRRSIGDRESTARIIESGQDLPMKALSLVVLTGSLVSRTYFRAARKIIEPSSQLPRLLSRAGIFATYILESSHAESRPHFAAGLRIIHVNE